MLSSSGGKSTLYLLVTVQFLCHEEESVSTFKRLAVTILWGKKLSFTWIQIILCNTIFYSYFKMLHVSIKMIMMRSSTRQYTTIDLHVTLVKITVLFENSKMMC